MSSQMSLYLDNHKELAKAHGGEIIAVRDGEFVGAYPSRLAAWRDMQKRKLKDGEYVILRCAPHGEVYSSFWANGGF